MPIRNHKSELLIGMKKDTPDSPRPSPRVALAREAAVLQLKLIADGFRDAALIPISFIAALIGVFRGGEEADCEGREGRKLCRRIELWINRVGYHRPHSRSHPAGSMDTLIDKVEEILREQYEKGRSTSEARDAIEDALEDLQESGRDRER